MSETPVQAGLDLLRQPFPSHQISKLPKPTSKDGKKGQCRECGGYHMLPAVHLDYVGHAALTDRLLDADPYWFWEPLAFDEQGLPRFDKSGGLWIRLTVCGITRLGYGHGEAKSYADAGAREKEVIGDALRNAAMRFGAALDLWHKGQLHDTGEAESEPAAKAAPAAPKGFDKWVAELETTAMEGTPQLQGVWKASPEPMRRYMTQQQAERWGRIKAAAAQHTSEAA